MKSFIKKPVSVTAFKWSGLLSQIKRNVPKQDLHKYFKFIDNGIIYIKTFDDGWIMPYPHENMIIKSKFGYNLCSIDWFNKLYESK